MFAARDPLLWRIPGYYFAYFAALGIFLPFWPLYLKNEGFDPVAIGFLMGLFGLTKLAGPPVVGWLSDHLGRPMRWVRLASLLTFLGFSAVFAAQGLWAMAWVMVLFTLAWNAAMPQFDAVTLQHLGEHANRYSRIRLWGSVGFIVTALGIGPLLDLWGAAMLPWALMAVFAGMTLLASMVPDPKDEACSVKGTRVPVLPILGRPEVALFLAASLLLQASHGTYYAFFSVHLEHHGHSKALTGALWALGVLAEVGIFMIVHRLLPRFGAARLMLVTLLLTALRWTVIGSLADSLIALILAQLIHAFSFGVAHAASIDFIRQHFTNGTQGRGQALLSSVCYGAGGVLGYWLAGLSWQWLGALPSFGISAGMALAGAVLMGTALRLKGAR
ncbi:MAG: MFS transporter [Halothiobacillaceae bacterium]|nr:MAG: MFS transporter [Halothiobacillaceae bacterium]